MKLRKKELTDVRAVPAGWPVAAPSRLILACLCAGILLASCATVAPTRVPVTSDAGLQSRREAILVSSQAWEFRGRMAISSSGNGGSANVHWQQRGEDFEIELSAPITRQGWRLRRHGGQTTLEGMQGGPRTGTDAAQLLESATGWQIPLQSMTAWVRGMRAAGAAELTQSPDGLPATIVQDGWTVEYRGWNATAPALPTKVFARKDGASVRLVIEDWVAQ